MNPTLQLIAQRVRQEIDVLSENKDWNVEDIFQFIVQVELLFDAALVSICRTEASKNKMKEFFEAVRPESYWDFLSPHFIQRPIGEGKTRSLPLLAAQAKKTIIARDQLDVSKDMEGEPLFEIRAALRLRRHLPDFFLAGSEVVQDDYLRQNLQAVARILAAH